MANNENDLYYLPVYIVLTKDLLVAGIPANMAVIIIVFASAGLFLIHSIALTILSALVYVSIFLVIKYSPKFDTKILDIILKMNLKKYIDY